MESAKRPERQRYRILGLPDFGGILEPLEPADLEETERRSHETWCGR